MYSYNGRFLIFICSKEVEQVIHSDNDFATVAYLRIKDASLEEKTASSSSDPVIPPVIDHNFDEVRSAMEESMHISRPALSAPKYNPEDAVLYFSPSSKAAGPWVAITDIHRQLSGPSSLSIEDEVRECIQVLIGTYVYRFSCYVSHAVYRPFEPVFAGYFIMRLYQHLHIIHGTLCPCERSIWHLFWQ